MTPRDRSSHKTNRLSEFAPELERLLSRGGEGRPPRFGVAEIQCSTVFVPMRDGTRLATDLYLPPTQPAPVIAMRTPYLRGADKSVSVLMAFARRGYAVIAQDCRGTGDSEPDNWDYYVFESEDGYDCVEWITNQPWFGGFIGACGGSYVGQTQWPMATHPAMSTIVPHVSGLGFAVNTAHLHLFVNGYARTVGKGSDKLADVHYTEIESLINQETLATGFFKGPLHKPLSPGLLREFPGLGAMTPTQAQRFLWQRYCSLPSAGRAEFVKRALDTTQITIVHVEELSEIFGYRVSHDAHTLPSTNASELCRKILAPPMLFTGWYDWCLNDAFATWQTLRREGREEVASGARMIITPHSHNTLGYREGIDSHPELQIMPGIGTHAGVLLHWYQTVRQGATSAWPTIIYYLMGANEWRVADDWPVPEAEQVALYLHGGGVLRMQAPDDSQNPDDYTYDPNDPTPTVGGSIVSFLYPPGSVDVGRVQERSDILVYSTPVLERDMDVVGPLRVILYVSSSAPDTDFAARLSDVFPDGRAIQLQNCVLRARYRNLEPEFLKPGQIHRVEIDLWATANRFKVGHRLRLDISSADFPRFDRNANLGDSLGVPVPARQRVFHDTAHPSHLLLSILRPTET